MNRSAAAPCQCSSPGAVQMVSPGCASMTVPSRLPSSGPVEDVQHLAEPVGVPVRAGARREPDDGQPGLAGSGTGVDRVDPYVAGEGLGRAFAGGRLPEEFHYGSVISLSLSIAVIAHGQPA